jgi:hypothetical protein
MTCSSFGVKCNYMSNIPDLQPVVGDSIRPLASRERAGLRPLTGVIWTSDRSTSYQLNAKCQDFITRYLGRSLITPDDPNMVLVNRELFTLTFTVCVLLTLSYPHRTRLKLESPQRYPSSTDMQCTAPFLDARVSSGGVCI